MNVRNARPALAALMLCSIPLSSSGAGDSCESGGREPLGAEGPPHSKATCVAATATFAGAQIEQGVMQQRAAESTRMPDVIPVPPAAQPGPNFNAEAATEAYLTEIPATARTRSDAYFEGGYWLMLWDFLLTVAVCLLLLNLHWSAAMRNFAERLTRFRPVQTFIYWCEYLVLFTVLTFPMAVYEGYFRERKYGLATQTFGGWLSDQFKGLLIGIILGGIAVTALFGIVRRLVRTWWIWGALVTWLFSILFIMIAPAYLVPIFYHPKPLDDPRITRPILEMAHANGIAVNDIYEIDESTKSNRMSANVSGLGKTMRITLNDNLLRRGSLEEIEAIMGHEMGHYVMHHIENTILFLLIVITVGFSLLRWSLDACLKRWGEKWQIRGIGDPAIVPLVVLLASIFFFLLTPVTNTFTRTQEYEADMYGLNASRQPDGEAQADVHLGEYRKMGPTKVEEFIFYDHPSGRNRIYAAMRWKAYNLKLYSLPRGQGY